jgi:hypothetical protein
MPLQQTSGNDTTDAYGGGGAAAVVPTYIEDVFNTWLYTGTGATQTITNGIDLSTKGGLIWIKSRSAATNNNLFDTTQGTTKLLHSNTTAATVTDANSLTAFNTTGFTLGTGNTTGNQVNTSAATYASWTFRKQPKFFDVVTYTGTGSATTISHLLGSVPGCIIVKRTDTTSNWQVYHNGLTSAAYSIQLNLTSAQASATTVWNSTAPTSSVFSVGTDASVNASGGTYVAYIFASNAGGFGLAGTDNVITCGTYTTPASGNAVISLGYEPQLIITKATSTTSNWEIHDTMRGFSQTSFSRLYPNLTSAEQNVSGNYIFPTATGFELTSSAYLASTTYIYIAIRRGPMKVPTDATKVFSTTTNKPPAGGLWGATNLVDFALAKFTSGVQDWYAYDRLRGYNPYLSTNLTNAEADYGNVAAFARNSDWYTAALFGTSGGYSGYFFSRAPSFFDEVCYTGTSSLQTQNHNLGVAPELIIIKKRTGDSTTNWYVYSANLGNTQVGVLSLTSAFFTNSGYWNNTSPTSSVFTLNTSSNVNGSGQTFVAYLFATLSGVSKVGSYTGNGTTQTINCGFTGGARFVLIKRTDSTGDWYVYDTARGMTTLTDPYLLINSTAAESATLGSVTTVTTGFALNAAILAAINTSAATYIFLAIA